MCDGEPCRLCGADSDHKLVEQTDDAYRRGSSTYLCHAHFRMVMGPSSEAPTPHDTLENFFKYSVPPMLPDDLIDDLKRAGFVIVSL
jgi:hypothetical protein